MKGSSDILLTLCLHVGVEEPKLHAHETREYTCTKQRSIYMYCTLKCIAERYFKTMYNGRWYRNFGSNRT